MNTEMPNELGMAGRCRTLRGISAQGGAPPRVLCAVGCQLHRNSLQLINHEGLTAYTKNTKRKNSKEFFVIFVFVAKRPSWFVLNRSEPRG